MIKSGKYALYCGKEYKLNRDRNGNDIIITNNKDYIDDSFVDKYGYAGWISSDNIQIVEEKHYIKTKEEK